MEDFQFYSTNKPEINENVLVHFIEKKDSYFTAKLKEYTLYDGILNFQNATKKKKIKSWNNIVLLNKNMVAKVEDIDEVKKIVKLSLIYLKNENLITTFNENNILEKFIKSFCLVNKYNFNDIWIKIIHKIDIEKKANNSELSLWNYFIKNIVKSESINEELLNEIVNYYLIKYDKTNQKIISKFGIISNIGIDIIKLIFNSIITDVDSILSNIEFILKYESTPNYIFETINNFNNAVSIHDNFIEILTREINNYNIKHEKQEIFIKIEFIGQLIS
jgi:translation initiation factor 2 alpha subunit (eIF-2alpha)